MCWRENLIIRRDGLLSVFISKAQVALLPKPKILRDIFKNFSEPRFQPTCQFPPKNTYHVHTGLFFLMCDYCLRDKHKNFFLVPTRLPVLTRALRLPLPLSLSLSPPPPSSLPIPNSMIHTPALWRVDRVSNNLSEV